MKKSKLHIMVNCFLRREDCAECFWELRLKAGGGRVHKWLYRKLLRQYNAEIPLDTQILGAPTFPHELNGIFISAGAKIGKGCVIFQQVTIGSNTLSDSSHSGCPVIGDNVYIGAGAKIIGNVRIGDNVRIGANCVCAEDIPDNATVVLPKPRIIVHDRPRENLFIRISEMKTRNEQNNMDKK